MTGCKHGCQYCYARKIAERFRGSKAFPNGFEPIYHPKRLNELERLQKPAIIFTGSMTDIFGNWWLAGNIIDVLKSIIDTPHHKFVILTKNPARCFEILDRYYKPEELMNVYFGTSVTGKFMKDEMAADVTEFNRLMELRKVHTLGFKTVISFEPLLHDPTELIKVAGGISWSDWIFIGGQTNPTKIPDPLWITEIMYRADRQPIFCKDNLGDGWVDKHFPLDLLPIAKAWGKA